MNFQRYRYASCVLIKDCGGLRHLTNVFGTEGTNSIVTLLKSGAWPCTELACSAKRIKPIDTRRGSPDHGDPSPKSQFPPAQHPGYAMPITTSNVRSRWNQPTKYERWYVSSLGRVYAESLARVLRPWLYESAGSLVLDIGCGPGLAMEQLLSTDSDVIGLDCSLEMAQRASERSQQTARPRHFVVGTVDQTRKFLPESRQKF